MPKQLDEQETDRAAAVHARRHPRLHAAEVERVQCDSEWLEQRRLRVGKRVGQAMGEASRPGQLRAQGTVDRVAGKPARDTEVLVAGDARAAPAARDRRVEGNPLVRPLSGFDDADELVTEDERLG